MDIVYFILLFLLFFIVIAILAVSVVFIYFTVSCGFMHSSPPVPSCGKVKKAMMEDAASYLAEKKGLVVMDLGSGWGSLLLPLAKKFPEHTFIGIEYGFIPYVISCWRARKLKNLRFKKEDFFESDISNADMIFLFLLTSTMEKLSKKCIAEIKSSAIIYANRFPMQGIKPTKKVSFGSDYETYYIYKF